MADINLNIVNLKAFTQLQELCRRLMENSKDKNALNELVHLLEGAPQSLSSVIQYTILPTLYPILRDISRNTESFSENEKLVVVNILNRCFKKMTTDKQGIFFNIYGFLVFECYNQQTHEITSIREEYKLAIMECMKSLSNSVSSELLPTIYTNLNAPKLCQIIFIAINLAQYEGMRDLRIAAIECIMAMARVLEDTHFQDVVMRHQISEIISVILTYTSLDVLPHISDLINYAVDSIDENITNAQVFLEVFNEFIVTLRRWLGVATKIEPIKSREQRYQEMQEFTVSGIDDFSDDTLEKLSAEEMFEQDLKKKQEELLKEIEEPEIEEYKKPDPPLTVVLTTKILRRTLHFLPSKNRERRMKALKILLDGIEILGDWEDELLPIVHEIWSPLVERFKEFDNPLIINYCFQLLIILGNLSKEFIRMRTTKEVLPHIVQLMKDQSTESFMKDRGSSYRYTQAYKLQLCVMSGIGRLMVDLDVTEEKIKEVVGMLILYLSNKQPVPLQEAVMESLKALLIYDKCTVIPKLELLQGDLEFQRNVNLLLDWSESKKLTDERDSSRNQQPKLVAKSVELSS